MDESLSQAIETRDAAAAKRAATEQRFQELELALQQAQVEEEAANDFARRSLEIQQELKAIKAHAKASVPVPDLDSDPEVLPPATQPSSSTAVLPRSEEDLARLVTNLVSKTVSCFHHFFKALALILTEISSFLFFPVDRSFFQRGEGQVRCRRSLKSRSFRSL